MMFYANPESSYQILGIYYVERDSREISEIGRDHTAISFRLEGSTTFYSQNSTQIAESHSISFLPSAVSFQRKTKNKEKLIAFHLKPLGKEEKSLQTFQGAHETEPLFRQCLKIWEEKGIEGHSECMSLLYRIFSMLQQRANKGEKTIPESIKEGVQYLREHFRSPALTVSLLAQVSGVSESYFRRIYFKHVGTSPWQTILDLRFRHAANLLQSGYYKPRQVAEMCGFNDVKYFRCAFKKHFGLTPSEYAGITKKKSD